MCDMYSTLTNLKILNYEQKVKFIYCVILSRILTHPNLTALRLVSHCRN